MPLLSCSPVWYWLMSQTEEKNPVFCLQKITLSPSQNGSCDHYVRGKLNFLPFFLSYTRENNGCWALFPPSLPALMYALSSLCCKAISSTSRTDSGQQKEETTSTAMAETISCSEFLAWLISSAKAWQRSSVGVICNPDGNIPYWMC